MILRVFTKKFLFHEIKTVLRLFPSFHSFIHTTFASCTCACLHAAAGLDIRGASQPGNYHQEDKIQGRRVQDGSLQEQESWGRGLIPHHPCLGMVLGKSQGIRASSFAIRRVLEVPNLCWEMEGYQGIKTCSSHHFSQISLLQSPHN